MYLQHSEGEKPCSVAACVLLSAVEELKGLEGVWISAQSGVPLGWQCVCVYVCMSAHISEHSLSLTWHQVMFKDGLLDQVICNQLCAVDKCVSCDVG